MNKTIRKVLTLAALILAVAWLLLGNCLMFLWGWLATILFMLWMCWDDYCDVSRNICSVRHNPEPEADNTQPDEIPQENEQVSEEVEQQVETDNKAVDVVNIWSK